MKREHYILSFNNLSAGGMVGGSLLVYATDEELSAIRNAARECRITIESIVKKNSYLWPEVLEKFMECGDPSENFSGRAGKLKGDEIRNVEDFLPQRRQRETRH